MIVIYSRPGLTGRLYACFGCKVVREKDDEDHYTKHPECLMLHTKNVDAFLTREADDTDRNFTAEAKLQRKLLHADALYKELEKEHEALQLESEKDRETIESLRKELEELRAANVSLTLQVAAAVATAPVEQTAPAGLTIAPKKTEATPPTLPIRQSFNPATDEPQTLEQMEIWEAYQRERFMKTQPTPLASHRPISSLTPPSQVTPAILMTTRRLPKKISC